VSATDRMPRVRWTCLECNAEGRTTRVRVAGDRCDRHALTDRQFSVLRELCAFERWARPMELGAGQQSRPLSQLVARGLAERRERPARPGRSASWTYRATARGHALVVARAGFLRAPTLTGWVPG
jgi:hypothetical protein